MTVRKSFAARSKYIIIEPFCGTLTASSKWLDTESSEHFLNTAPRSQSLLLWVNCLLQPHTRLAERWANSLTR